MCMFRKWFPFILHPSVSVLEIGSGSGFFTGKLLEINPEMNLTCLEPDERFTNYLKSHFRNRIEVIEDTIEESKSSPKPFDVILSHIVIHNVPDAVTALENMKKMVRDGGYVVTIEPHPGSRTHYAREGVDEAFNLLSQVKESRWNRRRSTIEYPKSRNPWEYCYPQLFQEIDLVNIHSYGWSSIFTLSDSRFDFEQRKIWINLRKTQVLSERERVTHELLEMKKKRKDIDSAYAVLTDYFETLEKASYDELNSLHEQHITQRVITYGQKRTM